MTYTEAALAELTDSIRQALASWEGCFEPATRDNISTIVAGERMAGVLMRVQILAETTLEREQTKKAG